MTVGVLDLYKRHACTLRLPSLDANMFQLTESMSEGTRGCKLSEAAVGGATVSEAAVKAAVGHRWRQSQDRKLH